MKFFFPVISLLFSLVSFSQTSEDLRSYFQKSSTSVSFLKSAYQNRNFEPLFSVGGHWTITAADVSSIEASLRAHGLHPADYKLTQILSAIEAPGTLTSEIFVAENILKAAVNISVGRVDPRKISDDVKYLPREFNRWSEFSGLSAKHIPALFDQVAPKNRFYRSLKSILARLQDIQKNGTWQPLAVPDSTIAKGQTHPSLLLIKQKLALLGYKFENENPVYDDEFERVHAAILQNLSVNPEKGISPQSKIWRVVNADIISRIRETGLQMEKARWLPDDLEPRHGIANIANQMFYLQDLELNTNSYVMEFRAIAGQIKRKTPMMKDRVHTVVLNPTWTVTLNIFFNDKLPVIKKDPGYLSRNGFRVISLKTDKEIDPSTIDWANVTRNNIDFQLVQKPNYNNALGVVKFPMTNRYAIYLHDTGDRHLFKNNYRLVSSGCVRLERPLDFAEYLLANTPWTRARIDSVVAKPDKPVEKETYISLAKPLTIYILNLTVAENQNRILFHDDYYGENTALYKRLMAEGYLK